VEKKKEQIVSFLVENKKKERRKNRRGTWVLLVFFGIVSKNISKLHIRPFNFDKDFINYPYFFLGF